MSNQKFHKISFCTTCMNRLEHLQKTLPKNLSDNANYPQVEFVVLDYNSTDGLEDWIQQNLRKWQDKVVYYKTLEPQSYARSHSRNMAFRLATGEILCNLDADNFTGKDFVRYINKSFKKNSDIFLQAQKENIQDIAGKICLKKINFEEINGYDEKIISYGFEDHDFKCRLRQSGLKPHFFGQNKFLKAITHPDIERIRNEKIYQNLKQIFLQKISPINTKIFIVFNDLTFESAEVLDNLFYLNETTQEQIKNLDTMFRFTIVENSIDRGNISQLPPYLEEVTDENRKLSIIYFYTQIMNKSIWIENLENKTTIVNQSGYGQGVVYRNFDYSNPIHL